MTREPAWLGWARRLQAISQNGLTFAQNPYDVERYQAVRQIAAEMMASGSGTDLEQVLDWLSSETGYATPKVDVRGAIFRGDTVLLVRERSDNRWTLPGGWADVGESPSESVVREVYEESGFQTTAVKLLAVYDRSKHPHYPLFPYHVYKMFFLCDITGGEAKGSIETAEVAFFRRTAIPDLSTSRVTAAQIERLFEHHAHPEWQTDFD
jgi:ADP-ribose pyrophosphatase YjhB (NUDIX family)